MVDPNAPVSAAGKVQRRSSALSVAATKRGLVTVGLGFLLLGLGFLALGVFIELGREPDQALLTGPAAKLNSLPGPPPAATTAPAPVGDSGPTPAATSPSAPTARPTATASTPGPTVSPSATRPVRPTGRPTAGFPVAPADVDLALHRPVNSSSQFENFGPANVTDGSTSSYWEGDRGFPQTLTLDLGSTSTVGRLGLALPTCCNWNSRTQTIAVYGSRDGAHFDPLLGPAAYTFDADGPGRDSVPVSLPSTAVRFVQLRFSANTGWPAAQLSELAVYSS